MRLDGKVAIVTGAARGLGKTIILRLAEEGAKVVISDIDENGCKDVLKIIVERGEEGIAIACDVTNRESVINLGKATIDKFGKIDILVNNAGITRDASLKRMTDEEWDAVIETNLKSVFICTQEISKYMAEKKYGRVISMGSLTGVAGNFGQTNYAASKAGIIGMTKTWALELGKKNITANVVAPGFINTEMTKAIPEDIVKKLLNEIPLGRKGDPEEVAAAVAYLASDEAGFVNGATLNINGGAYSM